MLWLLWLVAYAAEAAAMDAAVVVRAAAAWCGSFLADWLGRSVIIDDAAEADADTNDDEEAACEDTAAVCERGRADTARGVTRAAAAVLVAVVVVVAVVVAEEPVEAGCEYVRA